MTVWTAHLKPGRPPILLKEAWSWGAFLFGPLWFLFQRAWIPAVLQVVVLLLIHRLVPTPWRFWSGFGVAVLAGLLGRDLVRWSLARRGYVLEHVVAARDADAAFTRLLDARPEIVASAGATTGAWR